MDQSDDELRFEFPGVFRLYKSGRIDRLVGATFVPASLDSPTGISTKDVTIDPKTGVSARLYLPTANTGAKLPILVYFHGGAFVVESAFSPTYVPFLAALVSRANLLVVSVNYRMAPEHLLPAAYDDSWAATRWVVSPHAEVDTWVREYGDTSRVFVAGDSAGGNIAHHVAVRAGEAGVGIERMALVHPYFWGREPVGSETREEKDREWMEELWRIVNVEGVDLDDPTMNPMAGPGGGLERLGKMMRKVMVCVAERDWLWERGRAYGKALEESGWGGEVVVVESAGEDHAFHLQKPECKEALELMDKLVDFFIKD